ncbi:unnamed protein product [Cuscuta epithymum]|uniref:TF-B3 domain-containing protein n=1 Tax=Cuscuta epithymum TaxID=186058 RepID=A0AAV0EAH1_9ASTE|nr:unnamed protein product [Cuscuta epithymum]CAH9141315.1 unnamed protein product [Cuscuta epithymum]
MHPYSLPPSSFSYGGGRQQQQRVWLDGGGGRGDGEDVILKMVIDSPAGNHASEVNDTAAVAGSSGGGGVAMEKEHMFDKVVTPSDVGKLNRLVIPKQHAEKYFPLDSSNNEKGLLLNFEDRNGKPWRFRYSYWNSSQSYVMTKGWSRFVKEKKLDAGDVVSFQRGASESAKDRLFIDWRRRPDSQYSSSDHHHLHHHRLHHLPPVVHFPHHLSSLQRPAIHHQHHYPAAAAAAWNPQALFSPLQPSYGYSSYGFRGNAPTAHGSVIFNGVGGPIGGEVVVNGNPCSGISSSGIYFRPIITAGNQQEMVQRIGTCGGGGGVVFESVPVVQGKAAAKRLRLFGVNMDCPISDDSSSAATSPNSNTTSTTTIPATSLQLWPCRGGYYGDDTQELQADDNNKPLESPSSASMSLDLDM